MKVDSAFKVKSKRRMRTLHSCKECGKSFRGRSVLEIHLRTHSGEKPFECKSCGKCFRQAAHLTSHMNIACTHKSTETTATSTRTFPCDKCEKVFMYGHVLKQHLRTHSGERPYICDSCGKGFRQLSHLTEHRKVVCGNSRLEPGFECSLCKRRFSYKQGLAVHMRIHTGEKPFVCAICGQMFRQSGNLKIHMKGVHEEKPVKTEDHILCNTCGKVFTGKRAFSQHAKMHTKQKTQSKKNTKCDAEQNILKRNPLTMPEAAIVSKSEDDGKPLIKSESILLHNHNIWNFVTQNQEEPSGNMDKKEIHKELSLQGSDLEDESQEIRIGIDAHGKTQMSFLSKAKDDKYEQSPDTYIVILKPDIIPLSEVSQLVIKTDGNDSDEYSVKAHCSEECIASVVTSGQRERQKYTFKSFKEELNNVITNNTNGTCHTPTIEHGAKLDIKHVCTLINNIKYVPVSRNSAAGSFSKQTLAVVNSSESTLGPERVSFSESVVNSKTKLCRSNGIATTTDFRTENKDTTPKAVNVEVSGGQIVDSVTDQESSNIVHVVISDGTVLSCSSTSDMTSKNKSVANVNEDGLLVSPDKECLSLCYYDQDTGWLVNIPQYYCSDLDTVHNSRVIPGGLGNADAKHRGLDILAKAAENEQVSTVTVCIKKEDGSIEVLQGRELSYLTDENIEQNVSKSVDSDAVQAVSVGDDGLCHIALADELPVLKVEVHSEDHYGGGGVDYIVSKCDPVDGLHDPDVLVLKDINVGDRNSVRDTNNSFTDVGLFMEPVHKDANTEHNDHCVDESFVAPYIDVHESVLLDLYFTKEILNTLVNISALETTNTIPKEHYLHITTSVELADDKIKRYRLQLIPAELLQSDGWKSNSHFDGTYMKLSDKQLLDPSLRELLAQKLVDIHQKLQVDQEMGRFEVCERILTNKSMLMKHQESKLEPMAYRCLACKEVGNSVKSLSNQGSKRKLSDLKSLVDNGHSKESGSEDVSCTHFSPGESKNVSFDNTLPSPEQRENEKEQHSCVVCGKQFQFSIDCASHTKTHYKVIHPKAKICPKELKVLKDQKHYIVDDHQHLKSNSSESISGTLTSKNPESANEIAETQQDVNALGIFHDIAKDPASDNPHSADELSLCDDVSKSFLFPNPQSENKLSQLQLAAEVSSRPAELVLHVNKSNDDLKDCVSQNPQSENKVARISVAVSSHVNLFNKSVNDLKSVQSLKQIAAGMNVAVPGEQPVPQLNSANKNEIIFKSLLSQVTSGSEIKLSQFKTAPVSAYLRSDRSVQHVNMLNKPDYVLKDLVCENTDPGNDVTQDRPDTQALPHVDPPNSHEDNLKYIDSDNEHDLLEEVPDGKSSDAEFVNKNEMSGQLDNENGIEYIEELCNKSNIGHMDELHIGYSPNKTSDCHVPMTVTKENNRNVEQTSVQSLKDTKCVKRIVRSKNGSQIDNSSGQQKESYSCLKCCKVFKSKYVLKRHMIQHTGFKAFCCERCGRRFFQAVHLKSHMFRHDKKRYPCPVCKMSFASDSELLKHYVSMHSGTDASMSSESVNNAPDMTEVKSECSETDFLNGPVILKKHGLKPYRSRSAMREKHNCPVCLKMFKSSVGLRNHALIHENLKPFQCKLCGKCFRQKSHLVEHGLHHEGTRNIICETCGKTFIYKKSLIAHQRIHTNTHPFTCKVCQKSFKQSGHLASHSLTHTQEKHHRCVICAKSFKSKSTLRIHGLVHTNTRHFSCKECGRSFRQPSGLTIHKLTHNPVKSFKCEVCERRFSYAHVLKRHQLLHSNVRPFKCGICGKSFTQAAHLKVHQQSHANERLYECGVCQRRFNTNSSVQTHLVTHVKEKPFSCDECGKTFCSTGSLNLHKRKHVELYACSVCGQVFTTTYVLNKHKCKKAI